MPWTEPKIVKRQLTKIPFGSYRCKPELREVALDDECVINDLGQLEPNWSGAVGIYFMGEKLRLFPHEYTTNHHMRDFLEDGALKLHKFRAVRKATRNYGEEKKRIMDAALLDGCTELQAQMVAEGVDPELGEIPPIGWYELHETYASVFCQAWEMKITPPSEDSAYVEELLESAREGSRRIS